ncbi:CRISPR-associated endonuclease Cas1 [Agromyces humi]|uniref:hypothetical protein n=1 Tax=Agromyces humi TaxID=1766800 RepID=UPI0013590067|nr:hypothetical protein [Agromyces humi]
MRTTPLQFTTVSRSAEGPSSIHYAQIDYARIVKSGNSLAVVSVEEEDADTARQPITLPEGHVIIGLGHGASPTPAAEKILTEAAVRLISTVGDHSWKPEALPIESLVQSQAYIFASDELRDGATRRVYAARMGDAVAVDGATIGALHALDAEMIDETHQKFATRYGMRKRRERGGQDPTNVALDIAGDAVTAIAADVTRLLGMAPALSILDLESNYPEDLACTFAVTDMMPVGFRVGARKYSDQADVRAAIDEELHRARLVPRMIEQTVHLLDL